MALSNFDELNNLKSQINQIEKAEAKSKGSKITSFADWYGDMDLSKEEKNQREELAEKFLLLFLLYFLLVKIDSDRDYKEMLEKDYVSIANSFTGEKTASSYITERASKLASFVDEITRKHIEEEYYTSRDRGMLLSANEGNVIGNYREFVKAIKEGKVRKRWVAMMGDNRTRKTHREANDQERPIFENFSVGKAKLRFCGDSLFGSDHPEEIINCRCHTVYF